MNNRFVQAMGVAAVCYVGFWGISWALKALSYTASSFFYWVQYSFLPMSWEIALGAGLVWFLWSAVTNSRNA
jgi:hypothetical protein